MMVNASLTFGFDMRSDQSVPGAVCAGVSWSPTLTTMPAASMRERATIASATTTEWMWSPSLYLPESPTG